MPKAIDQQAIDNAKILDLSKPPVKEIGFQEFPQVVYRHPKDKSAEHRSRLVKDAAELEEALKAGWKQKPHIPVVEETADDFEAADSEPATKPAKSGKSGKSADSEPAA